MYDPISLRIEDSDIEQLLELLDRQMINFIDTAESLLTCSKEFSDEVKLTRDEIDSLSYNLTNGRSIPKRRLRTG